MFDLDALEGADSRLNEILDRAETASRRLDGVVKRAGELRQTSQELRLKSDALVSKCPMAHLHGASA